VRTNVRGRIIEAIEFVENGRETGYADLAEILAAYEVPVRQTPDGRQVVALRRFAEAFGQSHTYTAADETFYIGTVPKPVGADLKPWLRVEPPICCAPGAREPQVLQQIISQFQVGCNERYRKNQRGAGETYCNIFLWDVSLALRCEIPHWAGPSGQPTRVGEGQELDANSVIFWLREWGPRYGWVPAEAAGALVAANRGEPAVACWHNPGGIGHVAVVRPGEARGDLGVPIAQAGETNSDRMYLYEAFPRRGQIEYFVHA